MNSPALTKFVRLSNLAVSPKTPASYRTIQKLTRLASVMEPLENRTMMSAAPIHHVAKPKAPKTVKTTVPTLVVPASLSVAAASPTSVKLSWADTDTTATGYDIFRSTSSGTFAQVSQITSRTTFSYVDNAVASNTSYSYKVEAYNAATTSAATSVVTLKTPLLAPTKLAATAQAGSKMLLTWTNNDSSAAGYNILRATDGVHFSQVGNAIGTSAATFTDANLLAGTSYQYEVQAYKGTNTSATSPAVTAVTVLPAPTGLTASVQSSSLINLTWKGSTTTGYNVLRSTDNIHFTSIGTIATGGVSSFSDKTVQPFTTYYYQVVATTSAAQSPASTTASAQTPLATPVNPTATATASSSVKLTWTDADPAAKAFDILRSTDGKHFSQIEQIGVTTTWTDNTVAADTTYTYEIESVNGTATSPASVAVSASTPMSAPTGLVATVNNPTPTTLAIKLTWTDTDPAATQYTLLRSTNGSAYVTLATVSGNTASTYTDTTVTSAHSYGYEVIATAGTRSSAASNAATDITPLAAPSHVVTTTTPANSVVITWTGNDSGAIGYNILRSSDGINFTLLSKVTGTNTSTFTDATCASGHSYVYQVQAYGTFGLSPAESSAQVTLPLLIPANLAATVIGTSVNLNWINKDTQATGYVINRSTDGINFTLLVQLNSPAAQSYVDQTVSASHTYYYQIQAIGTGVNSAVSAAVSITTPGVTPTKSTVLITTRYGSELVITATGADDTVSVTQSGSTLTIVADGQTTTAPVPAAGLFIYTRGGTDGINVDQSVTVRTTVETIDGAVDDIETTAPNVSIWDDSTDIYTGTAKVHTVNAFAGGVSKATGAALANPGDAGSTMIATGSLWGTGPVAADVNQGGAGDCYFLSSLAAFAGQNPALLQQSAVDMGDGTYAVQFISSSGSAEFVRVSDSVSTYGNGSYVYARPGSSGSLWAVIMEKAFAYFRTGANTYASLNSGWMGEVYADLGVNSTFFDLSSTNASSLYTTLSKALAAGKEVTLGTGSAPSLVSDHAYTLISCTMSSTGVATYVVRNPWGVAGDSLENSQGYATLTFAQMQANFEDCCVAV